MTLETDKRTSVWKDALWVCLAVAIVSTLWIAYQSDVWDEVTLVQLEIKAQHDEFVMRRHLWDKSEELTAALRRTEVEQSQPSISEIRGLLNHVNTLRRRPKQLQPKQQNQ